MLLKIPATRTPQGALKFVALNIKILSYNKKKKFHGLLSKLPQLFYFRKTPTLSYVLAAKKCHFAQLKYFFAKKIARCSLTFWQVDYLLTVVYRDSKNRSSKGPALGKSSIFTREYTQYTAPPGLHFDLLFLLFLFLLGQPTRSDTC
jgi:hypothetical protein